MEEFGVDDVLFLAAELSNVLSGNVTAKCYSCVFSVVCTAKCYSYVFSVVMLQQNVILMCSQW